MKKILVTFLSLIIAFSVSTVVLTAKHVSPSAVNITKQLILSDEEPAPAPEPTPNPVPDEPK
jgi:hypothetical protein